VHVTMYTWEDLILFLAWGLVCYLWGAGERKYKRRSYQPRMPTKMPNVPTPPPPPTPLNNMCKGGWNSPPTTPRPTNSPPGQGRRDN